MIASSRVHLVEAQESYRQHLAFAFLVGAMLLGAGIACVLHSIIPAVCTRTASQTVQCLTELFRDRSRLGAVASAMSGSLVLVGLIGLAAPLAVALLLLAGSTVIAAPLAAIVAAVPVTYLVSNPQLNPVS